MDCDRTSRSPRLILDESIKFSSLKILLQRGGLKTRCSEVYRSWCAEKAHSDQLMKQRKIDAIDDAKKQLDVTLIRIKNGIARWLAGQAVAQYPCVCRSSIHAKTDGFAADP
jgi:hypothetical protein